MCKKVKNVKNLSDLSAEIGADHAEDPKLTLSVLRRKYKGKRILTSKLPEFECTYDQVRMALEWEFSYFADWSGEQYEYDAVVLLNEDLTIKQIGALHCRRYTGSDATTDGYCGKRVDDYDYWLFDCRLEKILAKQTNCS